MSHNHSLDDNDRWPWLERVRWNSMQRLQTDDDPVTDIIVTCSALKQRYRDVIRTASFYDSAVVVRFVFLIVSEIELRRRLLGRINHYMKADMLSGQLADLEHPAEVEGDVVVVDVEGSLKQSQELVLAKVRARLLVDLT